MSTIQYISADLLQPGDNTRKTFNAETLTRLKGSIRTYGVRRNLEVKAIEGGRYEIVTGERRWRATMELLAEMEGDLKRDRSMLPCLVLDDRDISHAPVLNIIENLLRDDVPPGEEAEGYYQLTLSENPDTGKPWTVAEIAEAVNQQPSYIRRRMQLRRAPAMLLDAVNAKKIPVTVAELVGRIPSRAQREVAAKLVLWPGDQEVPMDFEQAKKAINDRFYKSLNKPGFSIEDETLVPVMCDELTGERLYGGDCESCPHRSGRALEKEELAGGNEDGGKGRKGGIDPNLCTNIDCYRMKQDAAWKITRSLAEQKGQKFLEGDASRRVFSGDKGKLPNDSKYVDLDEKPREDQAGSKADVLPKWRSLVTESDEKVTVVVARHPITGRVHNLIAKQDAERVLQSTIKAAQEDAAMPPETAQSATTADAVDPLKEQQRKDRLEKKLKREVLIDSFQELFDRITEERVAMDDLLLSIELALDAARDACRCIADWLEVKVKAANSWRDYVQPILMHAESTFITQPAMEAFLHVCLAAQGTDHRGVEAAAFERMASAFRVSIADIEGRVRKAHALAGDGGGDTDSESEAHEVNSTDDPDKTPNLRAWVSESTDETKRPMMVVVPTKEVAKAYAEDRLQPWFEPVPADATPQQFYELLMVFDVPQMKPNENGVFMEAVKFGRQFGKACGFDIFLAVNESDGWFSASFDYKAHNACGGSHPNESHRYAEKFSALREVLHSLKSSVGRSASSVSKTHMSDYKKLVEFIKELNRLVLSGEMKRVAAKVNGRKQSPRVPDKDAEAKALDAYLATGSIKDAADAAQVTVNTVKKWHQRRGWKALRDEKIKADKKSAKK